MKNGAYITFDGDPAAALRGTAATPPHFSAHVHFGQAAAWIKMSLGVEVGLDPGHTVLDGDLAPPKRGTSAPVLAYVYCGQTAGWIKMPLGTEVGLGPGYVVLDGDLSFPKKGTAAPILRTMSIVANRLSGSECHLIRR